ncbi:MAG: hypothetical protein ACTHKG_21965 [Nocardioides sp.]
MPVKERVTASLAVVLGALSLAVANLHGASASSLNVDAGALEYWVLEGAMAAPFPVPVRCGDVGTYEKVVYGTPGDDVLSGGKHPQVLMGLGGNDVLRAGTQGDCLVGGPGNDELHGNNAKDILLGGTGDDLLNGGNGADYLDGGDGDDDLDGGNGPDSCIGGGGDDTIVNCEEGSPTPPDASIAAPGNAADAKLVDESAGGEDDAHAGTQVDGEQTPPETAEPESDRVDEAGDEAADDPIVEQPPSDGSAPGEQSASTDPDVLTDPGEVEQPQPSTG